MQYMIIIVMALVLGGDVIYILQIAVLKIIRVIATFHILMLEIKQGF